LIGFHATMGRITHWRTVMSKIAAKGFRRIRTGFGMLAGLTAPAAALRSSAQVRIKAPVARIWQLLTDINGWPSWNPKIDSANLAGDIAPGSVFVWKSQGFTVRSTIQTADAGRRLVWTGVAFGTRAVHTWEIQAANDGVLVTTGESFDGWLPWLLRDSLQKKLDDTLPRWLASLKAAAETPEPS
jgi:uncharacterized protein YndB with AHSA1/START domain